MGRCTSWGQHIKWHGQRGVTYMQIGLRLASAHQVAWPEESNILAGRSPLGVRASGLQGVEQVEVAGLVVLQRHQRRRQRAQQLLVFSEKCVVGVRGMTLDSRNPCKTSS